MSADYEMWLAIHDDHDLFSDCCDIILVDIPVETLSMIERAAHVLGISINTFVIQCIINQLDGYPTLHYT